MTSFNLHVLILQNLKKQKSMASVFNIVLMAFTPAAADPSSLTTRLSQSCQQIPRHKICVVFGICF